MRILFLTSAHNSLSQRLWIELGDRGHAVRVCVAATGEASSPLSPARCRI
jgi:putative two-component system hydrogenase maturation factor HypX/HoxX